MQIEYEATFLDVEKDNIRQRLERVGAEQIYPEFMQKRIVFSMPKKPKLDDKWVRLRQEQDRITLSIKQVSGNKIEDQKESSFGVDDWDEAKQFVLELGCTEKSYQENKRELWILDNVEITIDEWPFLEPFVEVEGKSEKAVKQVSEKLSFDYTQARFCAIGLLYREKYNLPHGISNFTPKLVFDMKNPFIKQ